MNTVKLRIYLQRGGSTVTFKGNKQVPVARGVAPLTALLEYAEENTVTTDTIYEASYTLVRPDADIKRMGEAND